MDEVKVCYNCDIPVVWTFAFAGAEYYCLNCGNATGMMGGARTVKITPKLKAQYKVIHNVWKAIYKHYLPRSQFKRNNCKKCHSDYSHTNHLTKREELEDQVASQMLESFIGKLKQAED